MIQEGFCLFFFSGDEAWQRRPVKELQLHVILPPDMAAVWTTTDDTMP